MTTEDQQKNVVPIIPQSSENSTKPFWRYSTYESSKVRKVHHLTLNAQQKPTGIFKNLSKQAIREKLAKDVESFLKGGGTIQQIELGVGVLETVFQDKK